MTRNWRRSLAESYFELGETGKAEALYRDWLNTDPGWGWGWIGWSDCYRFTHTEMKDLNRSEQLLREGLSIVDVRDRAELEGRLADLYKDRGPNEGAAEFRPQAKAAAASNATAMPRGTSASTPAPASVTRQRIGRNEPCPCGERQEVQEMLRGNLKQSAVVR
ncbi:MAG TPA: hypothetical protein VNY05_24880 [Candidatus Acidoferrales bacterium]|nr:hypothetical protein [Candidatus Acidoferrales bacterium]